MDMKQSKPVIKFKSNKIKKMLIEQIQTPIPENPQKKIKKKGQKDSKKDKIKSMNTFRENDEQPIQKIANNIPQNQIPKQQMTQKQLLRSIYQVVFKQNTQKSQISTNSSEENHNQTSKLVIQQILRLQDIQEDYLQYNRLLQKSTKKYSIQQKWKVVVLTYRQKLKKYESTIDEQNLEQQQLKKIIDKLEEDISRLTYMNNIKFQKINTLVQDFQTSQREIQQITQHYAAVQNDLTMLKQKNQENEINLDISFRKNDKLQKQLDIVSYGLQEITINFNQYKQKTIIAQKQDHSSKSSIVNILTEQCQTQKQIYDLKEKYQNQIDLLKNKLRSYLINQEELELRILQLQAQLQNKNCTTLCQSYAQTDEQSTVKACYFSTLAEDFQNNGSLDDYNQFDQNPLQLHFNQQNQNQHNSSFGSHNHRYKMNTQRQRQMLKMQRYSEPDEQDDKQIDGKSADLSFEERLSMNNATRYTQSLQQLSSQLGEAYQKINDLSSKLEQIEYENKMLKKKENDKILDKAKGGLLSSFFKK